MVHRLLWLSTCFALGGLSALSSSVLAQSVTSDSTVGTVVVDNGAFTITGGTQRLNTLFHSFTEFSPETANATFVLDGTQSNVNLVIGRVTGNAASSINGRLALVGGISPDLLLINPNGISFGLTARLALPGSFLASTAESVLFPDDLTFRNGT